MEDETYNGWSNYPTWAVNLWLSNDEGLYNETSELLRSSARNVAGVHIQYRCRDIGYGIEEGEGFYETDPQLDSWGKMTCVPRDGGPALYLFDDEIISSKPVTWFKGDAQALKDFVEELVPDLGATFAADLLGYALGEVDWYEIADAWLEEAVTA